MTTNELEELIKRAECQLKDKIEFGRDDDGFWSAATDSGKASDDCYRTTLDEVVAKLREWAMPKPPDMITLPPIYYGAVRWYAKHGAGSIAEACAEAIKPYEQEGGEA